MWASRRPSLRATGPGTRIRFDGHVEVGARMAESICRALRFSNDDTEQIEALVANHLRFKDVRQMRQATLKRFVRLPRFEEHLELHRLDCLASHGSLDAYDFVQRFLAETPPEQVRPPRLVTGDDLKGMGILPGPRFKEILLAVEEAQLDGRFSDRESALQFARSICQSERHRSLARSAPISADQMKRSEDGSRGLKIMPASSADEKLT